MRLWHFSSLTFTADCRRLRPQRGPVPYSDGSVGDHGCSFVHVQWPSDHRRWSPQHPAEQNGHQHQPRSPGISGKTPRKGDRKFIPANINVLSSFESLCRFFPARRRAALKCFGAPCRTMPVLWYSSAAGPTCHTATRPPSASSATHLDTTRYVSDQGWETPVHEGWIQAGFSILQVGNAFAFSHFPWWKQFQNPAWIWPLRTGLAHSLFQTISHLYARSQASLKRKSWSVMIVNEPIHLMTIILFIHCFFSPFLDHWRLQSEGKLLERLRWLCGVGEPNRSGHVVHFGACQTEPVSTLRWQTERTCLPQW